MPVDWVTYAKANLKTNIDLTDVANATDEPRTDWLGTGIPD